MQDVSSTFSTGTLIRERYLVKRLLEQDHSGAVYLVADQHANNSTQPLFALKEINCFSQQERYQLTFDILQRSRDHHQDVPHTHHVFNDDVRNRVYVVMDYVEEIGLASIDQQSPEQRLDWEEQEDSPTVEKDMLAALSPASTSSTPFTASNGTEQIHVSDIDMPPAPRSKHSGSKKLFVFRKKWAIFLFLLLFLLTGTGTGIWILVQSHHIRPVVAQDIRVTSTVQAMQGTPSPLVTPTSSPGVYPDVVGSYVGTLVDIPAKASVTMILQGIHQIGASIHGYLALSSPLNIKGYVSGTIDTSSHFQFLLDDAEGHPVFFLEGAIQSSTSLSGDFYQCAISHTQKDTCERSVHDYGIWNVLLVN